MNPGSTGVSSATKITPPPPMEARNVAESPKVINSAQIPDAAEVKVPPALKPVKPESGAEVLSGDKQTAMEARQKIQERMDLLSKMYRTAQNGEYRPEPEDDHVIEDDEG